MLEMMASGVRGFRRNAKDIDERGVDKTFGAGDAYEYLAPVINTDVCIAWLIQQVEQKGAKMLVGIWPPNVGIAMVDCGVQLDSQPSPTSVTHLYDN